MIIKNKASKKIIISDQFNGVFSQLDPNNGRTLFAGILFTPEISTKKLGHAPNDGVGHTLVPIL